MVAAAASSVDPPEKWKRFSSLVMLMKPRVHSVTSCFHLLSVVLVLMLWGWGWMWSPGLLSAAGWDLMESAGLAGAAAPQGLWTQCGLRGEWMVLQPGFCSLRGFSVEMLVLLASRPRCLFLCSHLKPNPSRAPLLLEVTSDLSPPRSLAEMSAQCSLGENVSEDRLDAVLQRQKLLLCAASEWKSRKWSVVLQKV